MMIMVYINNKSAARMRYISKELDKDIEDLAEIAIDEAALGYFRSNPSKDPTKGRTVN